MDLESIAIKEILTISFTLFAVIDILGNIPVLVTLKAKMGGHIRSNQATLVSALLMIGFLFIGKEFLKILGLDGG
jgi:multiple antibiotic resistance protein